MSMRTCTLREKVRAKLRSQAGATLLIALAFFVICALIGSVVLAQSAAQLKAVQARQDAQRGAYSVTSAANLIMENWEGKMVCYDTEYGAAEDTFHGVWEGDSRYGDTPAGTYSDWQVYEFWYAYGPQISAAYEAGESYEVPYELQFEMVNGNAGAYRIISGWYEDGTLYPVYGKMSIDADLCTTIVLYAYKEGSSGQKAYQATLTIPAIPSYDAEGKLVSFLYGEPMLSGGGLA